MYGVCNIYTHGVKNTNYFVYILQNTQTFYITSVCCGWRNVLIRFINLIKESQHFYPYQLCGEVLTYVIEIFNSKLSIVTTIQKLILSRFVTRSMRFKEEIKGTFSKNLQYRIRSI